MHSIILFISILLFVFYCCRVGSHGITEEVLSTITEVTGGGLVAPDGSCRTCSTASGFWTLPHLYHSSTNASGWCLSLLHAYTRVGSLTLAGHDCHTWWLTFLTFNTLLKGSAVILLFRSYDFHENVTMNTNKNMAWLPRAIWRLE